MKCIICSCDSDVKAEDVYQCTSCGHIYRHFRGDLEEFHRDRYRTDPQRQHKLKDAPVRRMFASNIVSTISEHIPKSPSSRIFEVGCGSGFLLEQISKDTEAQLVGCELDEGVLKTALALNPETYIINDNFMNIENIDQVDLIIAVDVLEHILHVREFLRKCHKMLSEKACLVLQVPIDRPSMFRPPNPNFDGHVHYFNEGSIRKLLSELFFTVEKVIKTQRGHTAHGTEMIIIGKKK